MFVSSTVFALEFVCLSRFASDSASTEYLVAGMGSKKENDVLGHKEKYGHIILVRVDEAASLQLAQRETTLKDLIARRNASEMETPEAEVCEEPESIVGFLPTQLFTD